MQEKVVDWLYNLQSRWGILKEEDRSLYEYAYRLLLSRILIYSIIIALGIITGNWLEMFSFLLPFVILRQYVGGIHLKRSVSCICVSGFLIFICGKYLAINSELGITFCIVWLIAIAVIFLLSPVDTGHKRLDEKERKVYGKSARKLLIIECVLAFCFGDIGILIVAKGIAVAHIILASGLILGKSQNFFGNKLVITNL